MKKYRTVDVDYSNCHPVIAEALKQGKHIWCYYPHVPGTSVKIVGYSDNIYTSYPYIGADDYETKTYHRTMLPVEVKKKFKSAASIIQWCVDNGWIPSEYDKLLFRSPINWGRYLHTNIIKFYAGKEYKPEEIHELYIHPDWLEEVR